jgi:hypothetical protein
MLTVSPEGRAVRASGCAKFGTKSGGFGHDRLKPAGSVP